MREVWGIGKRLWGDDWERRLWLNDTLVWTVMSYGVEIWGWKEKREIEMVQIHKMDNGGLDRKAPGYMVREETDREEK